MGWAIWYNLYKLKNVKNIHGGVLLLVKVTLLHGCFSGFLNCTNGTKSRKTSLFTYNWIIKLYTWIMTSRNYETLIGCEKNKQPKFYVTNSYIQSRPSAWSFFRHPKQDDFQKTIGFREISLKVLGGSWVSFRGVFLHFRKFLSFCRRIWDQKPEKSSLS